MAKKELKKKKGLSIKQKRFADAYIELADLTKAAIKAGYSKKSAASKGCQLRDNPLVKEYINARIAEKDNTQIAAQDEILAFLTSVMRGEVKEQIPLLNGDGFQTLAELDETNPKDRIKAAELLGKRYAMWTEKKDISGTMGVVIVDDTGDLDDE